MKKKDRFYNRLYFRIFSVFGLSASVLVLLIGVVFFKLYSINVIESFKKQLEVNATEIANRIKDYAIEDEDSGYADYIDATQAILESQTVDVWINDQLIESFTASGTTSHSTLIPAGTVTGKEIRLRLHLPNACAPSASDPAPRALSMDTLTISAAGQ